MTRDAVRHFEAAFAKCQEAVAARAFWMGRVGLYALLRALGVGEGDRVGICAFTCVGVVEAVTRLRATPVFLDVDRHLSVAPSALERLTAPLKVLVLQHTFGVPSQLDAALAWATKKEVAVIEDCCHSLDATWDNRRVGTYGLGALFAFEWGKPFSAGQGGMVTFQDAGLAREVDRIIAADAIRPGWQEATSLSVQRLLYRWLVTPRTRRALRTAYRWASRHGLISGVPPRSAQLTGEAAGFFKLCCKSQALAAHEQLRRWPDIRARRMSAAAVIHNRLQTEGIQVEAPDPRASPMYLRVPIWVQSKPQLLAAAASACLDVGGWYATPAHPLQGEVLAELGYDPVCCPYAEQAFAHVVTLPTRPALTPAQLETAMRLIRSAR
ncbi:MAG TPA: DegT/DnrJ/EryC1/StrS family aminotransferase [Phycisphaerae bacterium]|nr:DegT/DnrJ/EryC1/StrS family aminotransferase [Phycisphaerae bacterium]